MKIVHVIEPFAAGVAVFVKHLTETMPDDLHIIIHGERKQVMSARDVKRTFPAGNVRFLRWHSVQRSIHPVKDLLALGELHKILRRLRKHNLVDAVHLHSSKSGLLGRVACKIAGIKTVVYTPNGAPFLSATGTFSKFLYRQLEKVGSIFGGNVVCCSASELSEYRKLGINASYINNGVDLGLKTGDGVQPKKDQTFRVITSGRIEDQKNPALFNEIAAYFADFDQISFVWAGDGVGRAELTSPNITVTGWLNADQIGELVAQSDVYLSTSRYEGLSFAVLEALALRKPVLLTDCVGNTDVIRNGLNGDTFKNDTDAIMKILHYFNNREMMEIMGEYSHEICAAEFSMHLNFNNYKKYYLSQATVSEF